MSDMLETLWQQYVERFNARWKEEEQQWRDSLDYPEAIVHCDDSGVQRIQYGSGEEHIRCEQPVDLGEWQ